MVGEELTSSPNVSMMSPDQRLHLWDMWMIDHVVFCDYVRVCTVDALARCNTEGKVVVKSIRGRQKTDPVNIVGRARIEELPGPHILDAMFSKYVTVTVVDAIPTAVGGA